jgi:adenylate cyclase
MKRWLDVAIPGLVMVAAVLLSTRQSPFIDQLRNLVFDSYQRALPRVYEPQPVRIVDIDEESLKRLGQWPWPRSEVARLVDRLGELGAQTVALDILFPEPDRMSPVNLARLWREGPEPGNEQTAFQQTLAHLPDPDATLAESLSRGPTVTAFALGTRGEGRPPALKAGFAHLGDDPLLFVKHFPRAVTAVPEIEAAATGSGVVSYLPDPDNIVRRAPLLMALGNQVYPSFAAEALRVAQGASSYTIKASGASGEQNFGEATGITQVRIGQVIVPTDETGAVVLHDSGHVAQRFVPAWRVLEPDFDPTPIAGNIVIIGASAEAINDLKSTPVATLISGVEIHAQVIEQMLSGDFLRRPDWAPGAELVYLVVFGSLLIVTIRRVGALWSALIAIAFSGLAIGLSWYGFARAGLLIDPFYPCVVALLVYLSCSLIGYLRTERDKRFVRTAFGHYLSPVMVEALTKNPDQLRLGGEIRELTLLFSDVRGFTHIAEQLDPGELTTLINRFLTPLTRVIQEAGGTIDKYMGDCIMAFWNAPLDVSGHPAKAVQAALAMRTELAQLNENLKAEAARSGRPAVTIEAGIGLNSGAACVGNMGSEQRFAYSVIGDAVNIASRLESLSRAYGVDIVIGEDTVKQVPGLAFLELDQVRVKGRAAPLRIFTALGDGVTATTPDFKRLAERHHQMITAYRAQDWAAARAALADCRRLAAAPAELYELYDRRIADYAAAPPPANWDGVFIATTKQG